MPAESFKVTSTHPAACAAGCDPVIWEDVTIPSQRCVFFDVRQTICVIFLAGNIVILRRAGPLLMQVEFELGGKPRAKRLRTAAEQSLTVHVNAGCQSASLTTSLGLVSLRRKSADEPMHTR
jgi:hypothetical protein